MEEKKQRVAVYVDGSNLYFKLKAPEFAVRQLARFNYRGLAEWLSRGRAIISCRYYIGVVRADKDDEKSQKLRREQQRLFSHLTSPKQGFMVKKGYLMENDGVYHEKGVDVKLAVDLLAGAYEDLYDTAIIISSDTDLIPAIQKVKHLGKKVEYVGFAHQPSFGMQRFASLSRLLIKEDIEPFTVEEKPEKKKL